MEIKFNIPPIPDQSLEGRVIYVSRIERVVALDGPKGIDNSLVEESSRVGIQVKHLSEDQYARQIMDYNQSDFQKFKSAYGLENPEDLVGRTVISICENGTREITGLIPLGTRKR